MGMRLPNISPDAPSPNFRMVSGDYFAALGVPVKRGRVFTSADGAADSTFGTLGNVLAGPSSPSGANGSAIQPNGKIVLAGAIKVGTQDEILVTRINAEGAVSPPTSSGPTGATTTMGTAGSPVTAGTMGTMGTTRTMVTTGTTSAATRTKHKQTKKSPARPNRRRAISQRRSGRGHARQRHRHHAHHRR